MRTKENASSRKNPARRLIDALSALAVQGLAFIDVSTDGSEKTFVVDRVRLKERELLYLHEHGALTLNGIRRYLLTRPAA